MKKAIVYFFKKYCFVKVIGGVRKVREFSLPAKTFKKDFRISEDDASQVKEDYITIKKLQRSLIRKSIIFMCTDHKTN